MRVVELNAIALDDSINYSNGKCMIYLLSKYLQILAKNVIAYAYNVFLVQESFPNGTILASQGNHAKQTIGIDYYMSHLSLTSLGDMGYACVRATIPLTLLR